MKYRIQYLAADGEVRWSTQEAESQEEAEAALFKSNLGGSDDAIQVLSVEVL